MDSVTEAVKRQYTAHPYPGVPAHLRHDSFPYQLLSHVQGGPLPRNLQILDAGCGTGAGLIPVAQLHPDARVVGVDLSPSALKHLLGEVLKRGISNLEAQEADLLDRTSLEALKQKSPGGFHLIYASGVIHHLADPARGLTHLAELLAPGGIISLMVYGTEGRRPITRLREAMGLLTPDWAWDERVQMARDLTRALGHAELTDAELVDRYLHAHAVTYTVPELLDLIEAAGLKMLRWTDPEGWDPASLFGLGRVPSALKALPDRQRWEAIDKMFEHPALEVLLVHPDSELRAVPDTVDHELVAWNPQATITLRNRRYLGERTLERLSVTLRGAEPMELFGVHATLATLAEKPLPAGALIADAAVRANVGEKLAHDALMDLLRREFFYLPRPLG